VTLIVTLEDGRTDALIVPEGMKEEGYLSAFLRREHPFNKSPWIKLGSGEYVRYSFIVSIRHGQT
jgi:hypothetical protein